PPPATHISTLPLHDALPISRVAVIALAPAAVGILPGREPPPGAARGGIIRADARLRERSQYRPCTVDVVRAPAAEPRAVRFLLRSEEHTSELQSHLNLVCRL